MERLKVKSLWKSSVVKPHMGHVVRRPVLVIRFEVIKRFSFSTKLSMKYILLINVEMSTIVGILTIIGRINDWLLWFKPEISFDFGYFSIFEQLNFHAQLSWTQTGLLHRGQSNFTLCHTPPPPPNR